MLQDGKLSTAELRPLLPVDADCVYCATDASSFAAHQTRAPACTCTSSHAAPTCSKRHSAAACRRGDAAGRGGEGLCVLCHTYILHIQRRIVYVCRNFRSPSVVSVKLTLPARKATFVECVPSHATRLAWVVNAGHSTDTRRTTTQILCAMLAETQWSDCTQAD